METFFIIPVIILIIAMLLGIAGLIFLIIGLIQGKKGYWITGSVGLSIGIIIAVIGVAMLIKPIMNKVITGIDYIDLHKGHFNYDFSDQPDYFDWPSDTSFAEPVSGFIEDYDNSPVFIKIFPERKVCDQGITILNIGKDKKMNDQTNTISMTINFEKDFEGNISLTAYDSYKNELGQSAVMLNHRQGENEIINFSFTDETDFALIKYCTLSNK